MSKLVWAFLAPPLVALVVASAFVCLLGWFVFPFLLEAYLPEPWNWVAGIGIWWACCSAAYAITGD